MVGQKKSPEGKRKEAFLGLPCRRQRFSLRKSSVAPPAMLFVNHSIMFAILFCNLNPSMHFSTRVEMYLRCIIFHMPQFSNGWKQGGTWLGLDSTLSRHRSSSPFTEGRTISLGSDYFFPLFTSVLNRIL